MCATVRKGTRWKCCQGQKNGILPIGNFKRSIFSPFFKRQCALDLLLCFQQSRIKNNSRAKNTITQKAQGFMKDDWRWRLKDWSCAVGRGEGGAGLTGVYPQLLLLSDENSTIRSVSGICMRAAVARDASPGRDPRSRRLPASRENHPEVL